MSNSNPVRIPVHLLPVLATHFYNTLYIHVFFLFITNPMLSAASLSCLTSSSVALTDLPNTDTSSVYAIYCLVFLKIISHFLQHWSLVPKADREL